MALAQRRSDEARIKDRFRRRVRSWASAGLPVAYRSHAPGAKREEWIERVAVRKAHHNKCSCFICKRERYDRRVERAATRRLLREEEA